MHRFLPFSISLICVFSCTEADRFPRPPAELLLPRAEYREIGDVEFGEQLRAWVPIFDRLQSEFGSKPCFVSYQAKPGTSFEEIRSHYVRSLGAEWQSERDYENLVVNLNADLDPDKLSSKLSASKTQKPELKGINSVVWTASQGLGFSHSYFGVISLNHAAKPETTLPFFVLSNLPGCGPS